MSWAAVGAAASAALPFVEQGLEFVAAKQAFDRSKHVSRRGMQAAQFLAENQPSWAMEGLRKAGLNPILAASKGITSPEFAPRVDAPVARVRDLSRAVGSAKESLILQTQLETAAAERDRTKELARQERKKTELLEKYGSPEAEASLALRQGALLNQLADRLATSARTRATEQLALRTFADRTLLELGIPGARAMEELYSKHPELRQLHGAKGLEQLGVILNMLGVNRRKVREAPSAAKEAARSWFDSWSDRMEGWARPDKWWRALDEESE